MTSQRLTLSKLFERAGWRTVSDVPANTHDWPQGAFYGYDQFYDSRNVGYRGPRFGYPTMPDQYTLDAFHRLELAPQAPPAGDGRDRPRLQPRAVVADAAPDRPGARSATARCSTGCPSRRRRRRSSGARPTSVRAAYGQSIEYSLSSLVSFVQHYGNDNTVLVLLGDHQPANIVSGQDADHDVPITVVARDRAVLGPYRRLGLAGRDAPVTRRAGLADGHLPRPLPHGVQHSERHTEPREALLRITGRRTNGRRRGRVDAAAARRARRLRCGATACA